MKLSRIFAIPAVALLSAAAIEATSIPGGLESDRLERYREGSIIVHMPSGYREGAKDQCLVEDNSSKISYYFQKSTSVFALQKLFGERHESVKVGSIPAFTAINTSCDNLSMAARKWANFDEYRRSVMETDLGPLKANLRALATQEDASRFSVLLSQTEPR